MCGSQFPDLVANHEVSSHHQYDCALPSTTTINIHLLLLLWYVWSGITVRKKTRKKYFPRAPVRAVVQEVGLWGGIFNPGLTFELIYPHIKHSICRSKSWKVWRECGGHVLTGCGRSQLVARSPSVAEPSLAVLLCYHRICADLDFPCPCCGRPRRSGE